MPKTSRQNSKVRLSKTISPLRYFLKIHPDLESFTFAGTEVIEIEVLKSTKSITLHSTEIEVLNAFWQRGKTELDAGKITYNKRAETVTITFTKSIPVGSGKLHLEFRGLISDSLKGLYKSQYNHNGETKHLITTQFEATNARRSFPCFDEPSFKSVFELSLVVPNTLTAISNTVEKLATRPTPQGVEHDEGIKVIHFEPTPKMSTYLLAFMVGDFESIETKTKDGVLIRVFTTPGKINNAKFALEVARKSLEFLNDYFAIPYPLPVLDMIAIPDFSAGAMENWGAITYRETAILVDEKHTAFAAKQQVAETVAHELVHQWFGNLVTMEWWTHLWLNESFASYMSYIVLDHVYPQWKIWTRFVLHDQANALHLDSLDNTHPIEVNVNHPDEISEIFDAISYDKGASVLRMLHNYIGADNFRDGLRYYLKKHSYKNTESIHLWEAFEKVSKKPVSKFMKNWIKKPGYPLLTVSEVKDQLIEFSQSPFTLSGDISKEIKDTIWEIPIGGELLTTKSKKIALESPFLKVNLGEQNFHRTLYSPSLLAKLFLPIKNQELDLVDRLGVVRDLFACVKSGAIPTSAYLEFLKAYEDENGYVIWSEILSGMKEIYLLFESDKDIQKGLAKYYRQLLAKPAKNIGWKAKANEDPSRALLRSALIFEFGYYGDTETNTRASKEFAKRHIDPNLRSAVYNLVSLKGNKAYNEKLRKMYASAHLQEEQKRIGRALMLTPNQPTLNQNLKFVMSGEVRSQDAAIYISIALASNVNKDFLWNWLVENWDELEKRYRGEHLLVYIVKGLAGFNTLRDIKKIKTFFEKHKIISINRTLKQTLEIIDHKINWKIRDKADCKKTLSQL
jgi:puromycin-sensitive aminopeptidase